MTNENMAAEDSDNCIFIGKKQTMSYVFAVTTQAQTNNEIRIRARGVLISKAVDVSQIALNRFLNGWGLKDTIIGTQEKETKNSKDDEQIIDRVSFIDIILQKGLIKKG